MSNFSINFKVVGFTKFVKNTTSQNVEIYGQHFEGQHLNNYLFNKNNFMYFPKLNNETEHN